MKYNVSFMDLAVNDYDGITEYLSQFGGVRKMLIWFFRGYSQTLANTNK